jgi:CTP:molybdopterin cytidylyltransferase MocA
MLNETVCYRRACRRIVITNGTNETVVASDEYNAVSGRTVSEALSATNDVVVVLGANDERIRDNLKDVPVDIVHNSEWQQGMSSSIKSGVSFLTEQKSPMR